MIHYITWNMAYIGTIPLVNHSSEVAVRSLQFIQMYIYIHISVYIYIYVWIQSTYNHILKYRKSQHVLINARQAYSFKLLMCPFCYLRLLKRLKWISLHKPLETPRVCQVWRSYPIIPIVQRNKSISVITKNHPKLVLMNQWENQWFGVDLHFIGHSLVVKHWWHASDSPSRQFKVSVAHSLSEHDNIHLNLRMAAQSPWWFCRLWVINLI